MIDLEALKARLAEYDPALPRCKQRITREQNYAPDFVPEEERAEWDMVTYVPCFRPEGHEGVCRNTRFVLGFPGYDTLTALLDAARENTALRAEVERRRDVYELMGAVEHSANTLAAHEDRGAWDERAAVVAWLRQASERMNDATLAHAADCIDDGEHRREEDK